jgi:pimeloyl-ACP methyl ester carboxylesterase
MLTAFLVRVPLAQEPLSDEWQRNPVDDRTFQGFLQFFAYDRSLPFDVRVTARDSLEGVARERLNFQSTPGQRVTSVIYKATGAGEGTRGWIVLLHGGGPSGKDGSGFQFAGTLFARAGWNVLAFDMLHYGERTTELVPVINTSELIARLYGNPPVFLDWVAQTVKDAGRTYDYLVRERGANPARVVLLGVSRGAVAATIVGGADSRFSAVALLYAGHYLAAETRAHLPAACPANYIGRISPRPVFMINGTQDNLFLRETSVLPLQRLLKDPKTVTWKESGHVAGLRDDFPVVATWLRETVK